MNPDLSLHKNMIANELKEIYFICHILVDIFTVIPDMIDTETAFQVIEAIGLGRRCITREIAEFARVVFFYEIGKNDVSIGDVRQSWFRLTNKLDLLHGKLDIINEKLNPNKIDRIKFIDTEWKKSTPYRVYKAVFPSESTDKTGYGDEPMRPSKRPRLEKECRNRPRY
ncbi:uncharacterized protein [Halyomorpha halys]|uniref:uncharacterized protein n=1 Tax=Halyomorpha halys TaxID=286706 RepID=UPI0006D52054|nr:uncharacterized protein LOC106681807 [Halyomorpha halys]